MPTFRDFTDWLFPGQDVPSVRNPYAQLPERIEEILTEIADATSIPYDWLDKTANLLVDGLAGLQCLWYLHGLEGRVGIEPKPPSWVDSVIYFALRSIQNDPDEQHRGLVNISFPFTSVTSGLMPRRTSWGGVTDWQKGNFTIRKKYEARPEVTQTLKLGRWLERYIEQKGNKLSKQYVIRMRDELKQRGKGAWMRWRISTHPYDILTMSYNRPWSSCMRPGSGHDWEYGILTDLAAGSAIMFFYRPNADQPAGRITLRPVIDKDGNKAIYSGRTVLGSGPKPLRPDQIQAMIEMATSGRHVVPVYERDLCAAGEMGRALTRKIFSDISAKGCDQNDESYDRAYFKLAHTDWPEPTLNIGHLRSVAEEWKGKIECRLEESESETDLDEGAVIDYVENELANESATSLLGYLEDNYHGALALTHQALNHVHPNISSYYDTFGEDAIGELEWAVKSRIQDNLALLLQQEPCMLLAYKGPWDDLSIETRDFIDSCEIVSMYKFVEGSEKVYTSGQLSQTVTISARWNPDFPDVSIQEALRLESSPKSKRLYLPPEGDPRQLALFRVEPYEAHTVVAIWLDETAKEAVDEAIEEWAEDDELPPFLAEAAEYVEAEPGVYKWWDFVALDR
jgi:hypothetical protein